MTRIEQLAEAAPAEIRQLILDAQDQIQAAIDGIMEDAQDAQKEGKDKAAILSLSFGLKWDLNGPSVAVALAVATRRKFESVIELDDPDQGKLPIGVIQGGGGGNTLPPIDRVRGGAQ